MHIDPNCTSAWNTLLCGNKRQDRKCTEDSGHRKELVQEQDGPTLHVNIDLVECVPDRTGTNRWWSQMYPKIVKEGLGKKLGMVECVQRAGETIFEEEGEEGGENGKGDEESDSNVEDDDVGNVDQKEIDVGRVPEGWWHAVLNLDFTVAITANPLLPATLPRGTSASCLTILNKLSVLESMNWPKSFLWRFVLQAAERWPELKAGGWGDDEEKKAEERLDEGFDKLSDMSSWLKKLGDLHLKTVPLHSVVIIDTDSVVKKGGAEGETARLCKQLQALLLTFTAQRIIKAANAEVVLSGPSRTSQALRDVQSACMFDFLIVLQDLASVFVRWGITFNRWTTTSPQLSKSSQILDFVSRQCNDDCPWVVIDNQELGEDGPDALMLQILLKQQCITAREGLTDQVAAAAVEKLLTYMEDE
eukprot:750145-Hanusia_phi.AAC.3